VHPYIHPSYNNNFYSSQLKPPKKVPHSLFNSSPFLVLPKSIVLKASLLRNNNSQFPHGTSVVLLTGRRRRQRPHKVMKRMIAHGPQSHGSRAASNSTAPPDRICPPRPRSAARSACVSECHCLTVTCIHGSSGK